MLTLVTLPEAFAAIAAFQRAAPADALSEAAWAALAAYHPSGVDRTVSVAEALYADLCAEPAASPEIATLCGQLAELAWANGWHRPPDDPERYGRMARVCRRQLGELSEDEASPADDPPPRPPTPAS